MLSRRPLDGYWSAFLLGQHRLAVSPSLLCDPAPDRTWLPSGASPAFLRSARLAWHVLIGPPTFPFGLAYKPTLAEHDLALGAACSPLIMSCAVLLEVLGGSCDPKRAERVSEVDRRRQGLTKALNRKASRRSGNIWVQTPSLRLSCLPFFFALNLDVRFC